jgi:hypothetical protein
MYRPTTFALALAAVAALSSPAVAHCDTTNGPVVVAARAALDADNPALVLRWVRAEDEPVVQAVFAQTVAVRRLGPQARALADRAFFETVVRLHRASEGEPYTGLSDEPADPIIVAIDRALATGASQDLEQLVVGAVRSGLAARFAATRATRDFRPDDVGAGRAFVATYVPLTHWVEHVYAHATEPVDSAERDHDAAPHNATARPAAGSHGSAALTWVLAGIALIQAAMLWGRRHPLV